jgi:hypothetical protein
MPGSTTFPCSNSNIVIIIALHSESVISPIQAVEDLTVCLRRRQELLPEDSRSIAETHFQLGVALGFGTQFELAVDNLHDAIRVLEKRVANLQKADGGKYLIGKHFARLVCERIPPGLWLWRFAFLMISFHSQKSLVYSICFIAGSSLI